MLLLTVLSARERPTEPPTTAAATAAVTISEVMVAFSAAVSVMSPVAVIVLWRWRKRPGYSFRSCCPPYWWSWRLRRRRPRRSRAATATLAATEVAWIMAVVGMMALSMIWPAELMVELSL